MPRLKTLQWRSFNAMMQFNFHMRQWYQARYAVKYKPIVDREADIISYQSNAIGFASIR